MVKTQFAFTVMGSSSIPPLLDLNISLALSYSPIV